jgi:uncharacterized protein YcnI
MRCSGWSSRAIWVCSASALALGVVRPAEAHVVAPRPYVEAGKTGEIELEAPNERTLPMTGLVVVVPAGFRIVKAEPETGWNAGTDTTIGGWHGGSLAAGDEKTFTLEVEAPAAPGPATLDVEQHYPDGRIARWKVPLTVVPASSSPSENIGLALTVGALGLAVLGLIAMLAWRRGRPAAE